MNKDGMKGTGNKAKGAVKKTAGKATGDRALEGEGILDKAKGVAQSAVGTVKDAAHTVAEAAKDAKDKVVGHHDSKGHK